MEYRISYTEPHRQFIDVEFIIRNHSGDTLEVQLPAWRPGRYILQNFAKNVQKMAVEDANGKALNFRKVTKDRWCADTVGVSEVHVKYNYYAAELNAGSSWLDDKMLYVNPVTCCMYVPGRDTEPCNVYLDIPADFKIATGMKQEGKHQLWAKDFQELADCPFICSADLQHKDYTYEGVKFNLWFAGESRPDWDKVIPHFEAFTKVQVEMMGSFPVPEYHFLYIIVPYKLYHGVEHSNSTVITLGPSYDIMKEIMYWDFIGVSSHELFHTWNVKNIRPVEMMPYDFSKENYSRLGYVTEGVTTYYGDLLAYRSGVFTDFEYFKTIHQLLMRHFNNYGRFNRSVAVSSFDTWLDGYEKGIPDRKVSIYTEGALCALMLDVSIRKHTKNAKSLDDVMRKLYADYGQKGIGYSEKDYQNAIEEVAGTSYQDFFDDYYNGTKDYEPLLLETLEYLGIEVKNTRSRLYFENRFGFKVDSVPGGSSKISDIAPNSIADRAGLQIGDEILAINSIRLQGNLKEWCKYFEEETVTLTVNKVDDIVKVPLTPNEEERYYRTRWPYKLTEPTDEQKANFEAWAGRKF